MAANPSKLDALRIDRSAACPPSGKGWLRWVILTLAIAGTGGWWFTRAKGVTVKTTTVQVRAANGGSGKTLLNASGYVTTRLEATVSSKITGKVSEILVEEGMKVEKDQILAKLDATNANASLRLAEAQLQSVSLMQAEAAPQATYAEAEYQRLVKLESSNSISKSDLGKAKAEAETQQAKLARLKADVVVAERQVEEWQQQVADTIIRAPFAGVVTTKDSQPGEMISPMSSGGFTRTGICTLVDMNSLEIEVDVGESFINRVAANQPVEATLDAYPEWKIPCKVIAIIPTADRQKATVKVRVSFEKLDPRILPQMGVKVAFQSSETAAPKSPSATSLVVPSSAITQSAGRSVAWVVRDGKVERRAVTVGSTVGTESTLTAGLTAGETIILNPPDTLTEGATVNIESAP
jgi:RND family efflux transporter MFP subunit